MKTPAGEIAAGALPSFAKLIVLSLHLVKRFFPPPAHFFWRPRFLLIILSFPPRAPQREAWGKVPAILLCCAKQDEWRAEGGPLPHTRARELRRNMTDAERVLWSVLRRRQLSGFRFRRQVQIGPYFADVFCPKARLIIEVDGGQHSREENYWHDYRRTKWLEDHGCRVFRVWNDDVFRRTDDIADAIYRALTAPLPGATRGANSAAAPTFPHALRGEGEE